MNEQSFHFLVQLFLVFIFKSMFFLDNFQSYIKNNTFQELLLDQQDEVVQRTGCKVMLNVTYRSLHGHPVRILLFQQYQAF